MRKFILQAINQFDDTISGNAAANVEFNVYNNGGGLADIYTNDGSGLIDQSSPLLTDANGKYEFYADNGRYSILFVDETIALQNDLTDIAIYEYGSAGARDAATTAQALAGTAGVIPDAAGVHAAFNQYGIGSRTLDVDVINGSNIPSGLYRTPLTGGSPTGDGYWHTIFLNRTGINTAAAVIQIKDGLTWGSPRMFFRVRGSASTWSTPSEVYHTGNLIHTQNLSGAAVTANATISGANLNPAKEGTWRNVSGNDVLNNGYGLWEIVL